MTMDETIEVDRGSGSGELYWDPFDHGLHRDPHPVWQRMREEAPLYRNEKYDFWALTRFQDVMDVRVDWKTYSSARGTQLEIIRGGDINNYSSSLIMEDPPQHTIHRKLLSRTFTPRALQQIEDRVRGFVRRLLDEQIGSGGFDYVQDFGARIPSMVIASMLGTPDSDVDTIRRLTDSQLRLREGHELERTSFDDAVNAMAEYFMGHVHERRKNPTDDIMSALVTMEFTDEEGVTRQLTDMEACQYILILSAAGNETMAGFAGWAASTLARFPGERAKLVERPDLIGGAVEEILRYDPPTHASARVMTKDATWYGQVVPEGSVVVLVTASTGRDDREFEDPDTFRVERSVHRHLGFGFGIHLCLGASLARLEASIMLQETLARFPEWDVAWDDTELVHAGSALRGYSSLPISVS